MKTIRTKFPDGRIEYKNQQRQYHRTDGPAIEEKTYKAWYINGKLHRTDGPALEDKVGDEHEWYVNDEDITDEVKQWLLDNGMSYPFDDHTAMMFKLRFCL